MKKIIVICLTISVIIGIYENSKIEKTPDSTQQVAITLKGDTAGDSGDNRVQQQRTETVEHKEIAKNPVKVLPATTVHASEDHPSDETIIRGKKNGEILWRIYTLESSKGKNDGCRKEGKFNGFGYRQNAREHICFEYFEQVAFYVDSWIEEKLATHTLAETLCGYNLGFQSPHLKECVNKSEKYPYYKNYLSL